MSIAVFALGLAVGGLLALRPFFASRAPHWPAERPDDRDDVARAVSSLRDLEFARAAGTISEADAERLRARLEREAFAPPPAVRIGTAPVRTFVIAALIAGITASIVAVSLPRSAGDRAPGTTITGTVPEGAPSIAELAAEARARPNDIPARLALADAYSRAGRASEAAVEYQAVLALDSANVPALNGLGLILFQSGSLQGALLASERVLALRPRDTDALFLKGLVHYRREEWREAVETWRVFLDVGEFHPAASMVRPLYEDARNRSTAR